jgi:isopentenyldiphosphate isomerase
MTDELIDILDENGNFTGKALKSEANEKGLWHQAAHLWVYNSQNEILLQLRAPQKKLFPDLWDTAAAGHVSAGEDILTAMLRETDEEIGLRLEESDLTKLGVWKVKQEVPEQNMLNFEFVHAYLARYDGPLDALKLQEEEVSTIKYMSLDNLLRCRKNAKENKKFVPHEKYDVEVLEAIKRELFRKTVEIDPARMLIIPSKSRYDLSVEKYGSVEAARSKFRSKRKWREVVESNERQKANWKRVEKAKGKERMIDRSLLTPEMIAKYDLFVSLGGDNHLTYCSQVVLEYMKKHPEEAKYMMGVVLDPVKSHGGLLHFDVDEFLESDLRFQVENWTTLEAEVDNGGRVKPYNGIGDFFVGEYSNLQMSRSDVYELFETLDKDEEPIMPEKSSGILIVTGAGSGNGSWYDNVHRCYFDRPDEFGREEEVARIILRENRAKCKRILEKGDTVYIDSYNDARGIVAPDSHEENAVDFDMGARAAVRISDLKLKVVRR